VIAPSHPYPTRLIDRWTLAGGRRVIVRPVLPQDAELEQSLVRGLSPEARYNRFFNPIRELSPGQLEQMTQIDYRRHVALVAESFDGGAARVVGEARYVVDEGGRGAEFAVVVADDWRRLGLATRLLRSLREHACEAGLETLYGDVLASNEPMLAMLRRLGFRRRMHPGDPRLVLATIGLNGEGSERAPCKAARVPLPWRLPRAGFMPAL
jgi:acetyltransferase